MGNKTDQDEARQVGDRLAPPTIPDKDSIREDRAALKDDHGADRMPTPDEEAAAERSGDLDPEVADSYKEAIERGAAQEGEGKPGL
ncbi:MAG TPA: hypothetical protein VIR58_20440 [Acidimicrobiales bacterium]